MCHAFLRSANFWSLLLRLDEDLAAEVRAAGCAACGGVLHSAAYPRKPRGVDARSGDRVCALYPLDKNANASGARRALAPISAPASPPLPAGTLAPLLRKLVADYAATGLPPAYVPLHDDTEDPAP